jgi:type I restriction enzyme R subunit
VNRTMAGKNAGYIVDYHGVVEHLDHALKIYGGEVKPSQVWEGVETELPKLQATLERILSLLPKKHDPVSQREDYKEDAEILGPGHAVRCCRRLLGIGEEL